MIEFIILMLAVSFYWKPVYLTWMYIYEKYYVKDDEIANVYKDRLNTWFKLAWEMIRP